MTGYLLDGRALQDRSSVRGIGTYMRGLLQGMRQLGVSDELTLLLSEGKEAAEGDGFRDANFRLPAVSRQLQPLIDPFLITFALRRIRPLLYHGIEFAQPLVARTPVVITVHDLVPFVLDGPYVWQRRQRVPALKLLRRADALIADSAATAEDVVRIARVSRERLRVIPLAVADAFKPASEATVNQVRGHHRLERPYLLAAGTFDPRKRVELLADVFAHVRRDHDVDLVIAGDQAKYITRVRRAFELLNLEAHVHLLGFVPARDLAALYSGAVALVFTSAYEGFGLPPLEAMACGCPVVMFDNSSLPEVAGEAAHMVRDGDAPAMTAAVSQLLTGAPEPEARRREGIRWAGTFSWRATAERTLAVYRSLA